VAATRCLHFLAREHKALACDTSPWPSPVRHTPSRPRSASPEGRRAPRLAPCLHRRSAACSLSLWAPLPLLPALALLTKASRSQAPLCFPPPSSASTERHRARSSLWAAWWGASRCLPFDISVSPCHVYHEAPTYFTSTKVCMPERMHRSARSAMAAGIVALVSVGLVPPFSPLACT
jgi:hypothetical protein